MFLRQLALILQSGLPLLQAMELLQLRMDKKLHLLCYHLYQLLLHGSTLAEAMAQEKQFFPPLAIQLVTAGEVSGQLSVVLEELAAYYEQQERLQQFVIKTALYPLFLLCAALCVLVFFLLYMLPMLASVYAGMSIKPTGTMARLLAVHNFLTAYPWLSVAGIALLFILVKYCGGEAAAWMLSRRWCGNFYGLLYEVRFCKLLALLLDSGINITLAVKTIAGTMTESPYERQLLLLNSRLQRGVEIAASLAGVEGLFSPITLNLLGVGASTGYLPQMLREAAIIGEQNMQGRIAGLKEVLAPILLLLAALIVATVVWAVLEPLIEMLSALPE